MTLVPGTRIGLYEIVTLIGRGAMGEVYRATDARLGRDVAVKVLPEEMRADPQSRRQPPHCDILDPVLAMGYPRPVTRGGGNHDLRRLRGHRKHRWRHRP
jgi:serine/threonine protein kinase